MKPHQPRIPRATNEDGFTLLEIMIVVVIIGILAAIAIPIYGAQQRQSIIATIKSDIRSSVPVAAKQMENTLQYLSADEFTKVAAMSGKNNVVLLVTGTADGVVACIWGSHVFGPNDTVSYHYSSATGKIGDGGCLGTSPDNTVVVVGTGPTYDDPSTPINEGTATTPIVPPLGAEPVVAGGGVAGEVATAPPIPTGKNKYPVCHGDDNNDHQLLMLPLPAITFNGHDGHGTDVIPPIAGEYQGKGWDAAGWNTFVTECS